MQLPPAGRVRGNIPLALFRPAERLGSSLLSEWMKSRASDRRHLKSVLSKRAGIRFHECAPQPATIGFFQGESSRVTTVPLRCGRNTNSTLVEDHAAAARILLIQNLTKRKLGGG